MVREHIYEICMTSLHWNLLKYAFWPGIGISLNVLCVLEKNLYFIVYMSTQFYYMQIFYLFLTFFLICQLLMKVCFTISNEKCPITVNIFVSPYNFISKMYDFLSFFFQTYWGKVVYIILQFPWVQMAKLRSTFILRHKNRIACDHNKPMWC